MPAGKNGHTILLAEDDLEVRSYLETALRCQGYSIELAQDGDEVLACLRAGQVPVSAVVLDIIMPRRTGLEALKEIRRINPELPVILISGAVSTMNAAEALQVGANDFLAKPIKPEELRHALDQALKSQKPANPEFGELDPSPISKQVLFGTSPQMREIQNLIGQIAWSEEPVLIQGETGTGKEVLARELHARSPRAKKSILKLNCVALPSELVESELFGYERGAFTGAVEKKPGMFALADHGTILLDEIGDMDFKLQAKLLQVLQDQEFQRLGGKETIKVDVRVIAATHRDLEDAIAAGRFREDLFYRLNVINLRVPPLRERPEDIAPLSEFLLKKHTQPGMPLMQLTPTLRDLFQRYRWPGNVRELENMVRKFLVLRDARFLEQDLRQKLQKSPTNGHGAAYRSAEPAPAAPDPVPSNGNGNGNGNGNLAVSALDSALALESVAKANREAERVAIVNALKTTNWNRKQAASLLQVDYKALLYKMNKLSIKKEKNGIQPIHVRSEAPKPQETPTPVFARALG